jgi:hypothetical protein
MGPLEETFLVTNQNLSAVRKVVTKASLFALLQTVFKLIYTHTMQSKVARAASFLFVIFLMIFLRLVKGIGRYYFGHNPIPKPSRFFEFFY